MDLGPCSVPVAIIAEKWPVWISSCSDATGLCLTAVAYGPGKGSPQWRGIDPGLVCSYTPIFWEAQPVDTLFLISGSAEFIVLVLSHNLNNRDYVYSEDLGGIQCDVIASFGHSFKLKHSDFGGVTSGTWRFGLNLFEMNALLATPLRLRLGHILSDMEKGKRHEPPTDPDALFDDVVHLSGTKVVHPGGLIPIRALRSDVLCYSVYSPTKWATRVLTVEELGRCLETYAIHLPQQKNQRISKVPFGQIPFVFSAPGRLVQVVVKLITQVFLFRQVQEQPDQDTVRQTIPEALVDTPYGLEKDIREDTLEDDAFGRDKAAKDDDADVAVMDWD
jgi:hypothetical protein